LFSSSEVAEYINATFEPVWESVRAAPLVTIDFGNGHTVKRTLQGNIATYVCGSDGTVYDVLPGIYTPDEYRKQLEALKALADSLRPFIADPKATPLQRLGAEWTVASRLREYHARNEARLSAPDIVQTVAPRFQWLASAPARSSRTSPPVFGGAGAKPPVGNFGGFGGNPGGFGGQPTVNQMQAVARTGGGFKGGFGGFQGMTFSGIEGPVARVIVGAPTLAVPAAVPKGRLADRPELKLDTEVNERIRRKAVHEHLVKLGTVQPGDLKKWLFREVLHADLDDPKLGLGAMLNENYPFAEEDAVLEGKK